MPGLSTPPCWQRRLLPPSRICSLAVLLAVPLSCLATDYPPPPGPYPVGPLTAIAAPSEPEAGSVTDAGASSTPGTTRPHLIGLSNNDTGLATNPYDASVLFGAPPRAAADAEQPAIEPPAAMMPPSVTDYGRPGPAHPESANAGEFSMDFSRDRRQTNPGGAFEQAAPPYVDYARPETPPMHYDSRGAAITRPGYAPGYGPEYAPGPGYDYGNGYVGGAAPGDFARGDIDRGYAEQGYRGGYAGYPEGYYEPGYAPPSAQPDMPVASYTAPSHGSLTPGPAPIAGETGEAPPVMRFRPPGLLPQ